MGVKVLELHKNIYEADWMEADRIREEMAQQQTYFINLMASPGAGKTTLLLETIKRLRDTHTIGVMEADIEAVVDAEKMEAAGVRSLQVHTGGECAMNVSMTRQTLDAFDTKDLDLLFLENVGNLVCPAEEDVGAHARVALLSVPEGDDKPLKYPLMFQVADAVVITKIDTKVAFDFDDEAVRAHIHMRNPKAQIFFVSAKTGEGMEDWCNWLRGRRV